jgi:hypothetical protein
MSKFLAVNTVSALALALGGCSTSTAPVAKATPRTVSVTTTAAVPAVPTAPVTLTTNSTESNVSVTIPLDALQTIVAALGGPVIITMTDLAPKDYTSSLSAGSAAVIDPVNTTGIFQFSAARSSASLSAVTSEMILAQTAGTTSKWNYFRIPHGDCQLNTLTAYFLTLGGTKTKAALSNASESTGLYSVQVDVPNSMLPNYTIVFECKGVSGTFGA